MGIVPQFVIELLLLLFNRAGHHKSRAGQSDRLMFLQNAQKRRKQQGATDRPADGQRDRRTDGPTNMVTYRVSCLRRYDEKHVAHMKSAQSHFLGKQHLSVFCLPFRNR